MGSGASMESCALFDKQVLQEIEATRAKGKHLLGPTMPTLHDHAALLGIVACLASREHDSRFSMWYLWDHISLMHPLEEAYASKSFHSLLSHPQMPRPSQPNGMAGDMTDDGLHAGFISEYRGDAHKVLIKTLLQYQIEYANVTGLAAPYSMSLAIPQSSGMGKSRLIAEAAKRVLTISINIREHSGEDTATYPPADWTVRSYFGNDSNKSDIRLQIEYAIFLEELFRHTMETIKSQGIGVGGPENSLAVGWSEYMMAGQSTSAVGPNRRMFYNEVVWRAEERRRLVPWKPKRGLLEEHTITLRQTCQQFFDELKPLGLGPLCLVSFDDAYMLAYPRRVPNTEVAGTCYHNLDKVLSTIIDYGFFFVFLSSDCQRWSLPSLEIHPSARRIELRRNHLFAPFTKLPFDVFAKDYLSTLKPLSLEKVSQVDTMVSMGRPLWSIHHSEHKRYLERMANVHSGGLAPEGSGLQDVIQLATLKLQLPINEYSPKSVQIELGDDSYLAALGVRIGFTFNTAISAAFDTQSRLVKHHMRVATLVPLHSAWMCTGAPSEPILAEGAGRVCNVETQGPEILNKFSGRGVLVNGERAGIVGRMILTAAHDRAMKTGISRRVEDPHYHIPFKFLDLLRGLFSPKIYTEVLKAKPAGDKEGLQLQHAFQDAYVHFSHFAFAKEEMLHPNNLYKALVRGMALQCTNEERSIDAVIPIHFGTMTDSISPATTSAINLLFMDRRFSPTPFVDRSITVPNHDTAALSIIMRLGDSFNHKGLVSIEQGDQFPSTKLDDDPTYHDRNHYVLVTYGHDPGTYGVITETTEPQYTELLTPVHVFPREDEENKRLLLNMKPVFSGEETDWF